MTTTASPSRAAARDIAEGLKLGVNLGKPVPCQWNAPGEAKCTTQATWAGVHVCCGRQVTLCTPHKERAAQVLTEIRAKGPVMCVHCGALPFPDPDVHPI